MRNQNGIVNNAMCLMPGYWISDTGYGHAIRNSSWGLRLSCLQQKQQLVVNAIGDLGEKNRRKLSI